MRFENFDNDHDDDEDFEEGAEISPEMMANVLEQSTKNREEEVRLANKHLKSELLDKAIFACKNSWLWGFLPHTCRLQQLAETYEILKKLSED